MSKLVVPFESLSAHALQGVIEDFVTREGTEYGVQEVPLVQKVRQVTMQLQKGLVVIVWDTRLDSASIVPTRKVQGP